MANTCVQTVLACNHSSQVHFFFSLSTHLSGPHPAPLLRRLLLLFILYLTQGSNICFMEIMTIIDDLIRFIAKLASCAQWLTQQ